MLMDIHIAATIKVGIMNSSQVTIKREKQMMRSIRRQWQKMNKDKKTLMLQ